MTVITEQALKRSSASLSQNSEEPDTKRIRRQYHHHHRLQKPVITGLVEPAITDNVRVDQLMDRVIGRSLRDCGFDLADPVALDSFRNAAEEYILKFAFIVRQSMTSCRRLQPIPHDFEHALKRMHLHCDDLIPLVQPSIPPSAEYIPTLLPSPPPEDEETVGTLPSLPFLGPHLSGEGDRMRSAYIPKHFPAFPSRHTYRHTPVFTERERDPRKIRERATEDGRHGEEALRKLARAASKDQQLAAGGRDKKPWGRRMESMDSMFERTVKGLAKKMQKSAEAAMEASAGVAPSAASDAAAVRVKSTLNVELGPIVNCERDLWRRTTASTSRNVVDKGVERKNVAALARLNSWVSTQ